MYLPKLAIPKPDLGWTSEEKLSRKDVYTDWLKQQFDARGATTC